MEGEGHRSEAGYVSAPRRSRREIGDILSLSCQSSVQVQPTVCLPHFVLMAPTFCSSSSSREQPVNHVYLSLSDSQEYIMCIFYQILVRNPDADLFSTVCFGFFSYILFLHLSFQHTHYRILEFFSILCLCQMGNINQKQQKKPETKTKMLPVQIIYDYNLLVGQ